MYPKEIYWIPVRLWKTSQKNLLWFANILWYTPWAKRNEIIIFENSFKYWENYLNKIIEHEASHHLFHRYYSSNQKAFVKWLFDMCKDEVFPSNYSKTTHFEFQADIVAYWMQYIDNDIELPQGKNWTKETQFIYELFKKLNNIALKKKRDRN